MEQKSFLKRHPILTGFLALFLVTMGKCGYDAVLTSYNQRYLGHGFDYMNGYSSTDFTGYHVYDDEKLVHVLFLLIIQCVFTNISEAQGNDD